MRAVADILQFHQITAWQGVSYRSADFRGCDGIVSALQNQAVIVDSAKNIAVIGEKGQLRKMLGCWLIPAAEALRQALGMCGIVSTEVVRFV